MMFEKNVICVFVLDLKKEIVISHVIFAGKRNWCMQHKEIFQTKAFYWSDNFILICTNLIFDSLFDESYPLTFVIHDQRGQGTEGVWRGRTPLTLEKKGDSRWTQLPTLALLMCVVTSWIQLRKLEPCNCLDP